MFRCLYGLPILVAAAWWEHRRSERLEPRRGARLDDRPRAGLDRRTVALAAVAGAFFAADLTAWHHAIEAVGAGLSTVLGNLSVLVVGIGAWLFLGERPSRKVLVAVPIVLLGVVLISGLVDERPYGRDPAFGVALGILTALSYGGYLLVIRHASRQGRSAGPVAVSTASTTVVALLAGFALSAAGLGEIDLIPSWPAHGWLLAYGLTAQSLGYLLISLSLPRLPAVLTSIILLAQPVATVILSRLLLNETPSLAQLAGVALVVGGIAVATVPFDRIREGLSNGRAGDPSGDQA